MEAALRVERTGTASFPLMAHRIISFRHDFPEGIPQAANPFRAKASDEYSTGYRHFYPLVRLWQ